MPPASPYGIVPAGEGEPDAFPYPGRCYDRPVVSRAGDIALITIKIYPVAFIDKDVLNVDSLSVNIRVYGQLHNRSVAAPHWVALVADETVGPMAAGSQNYYVVVTSDLQEQALLPLLRLRAAMGYDVSVIRVAAGITADDLRALLSSLPAGSYVLLVGDNNTLPPAYFYAEEDFSSYGEDFYKATDLYYALLDGDWDPDGDGRLIEALDTDGDNYPDTIDEPLPDTAADLMIGRIPFNDPQSIAAYVSSVVEREAALVTPGLDMLFSMAILNYDGEPQSSYPKTDGAAVGEAIISNIIQGSPRQVTYVRLYEGDGLDPSDYPYDAKLNLSNHYFYAFTAGSDYIATEGHGNQNGQYRKILTGTNQFLWEEFQHTSSLPSASFPGIMYVDACLAGFFDYTSPSLAETALARGLAAVIASSRISYYMIGWTSPDSGWYDQQFHYLFWYYMFNDTTATVSDALYASKYDYASSRGLGSYASLKDFLVYNLLGDPALRAYVEFDNRLRQDVTHRTEPGRLVVDVHVYDSQGNAVSGALVTAVTNQSLVLAAGTTDANGNVSLVINASLLAGVDNIYVYSYKDPYPVAYTTVTINGSLSPSYIVIGNLTPTGVSSPNFQVQVAGPASVTPGASLDLSIAYIWNGSPTVPDAYQIAIYPDTLQVALVNLSTPAGFLQSLHISNITSATGYIQVIVSAAKNGYTSTAIHVAGVEPAADYNVTQILQKLDTLEYNLTSKLATMYNKLNSTLAYILLAVEDNRAILVNRTDVIIEDLNNLEIINYEIRNRTIIIETNLGDIITTLDTINASITGINQTTIEIQTQLGIVHAKLDDLNASIQAINEYLVIVNTTLENLIILINNTNLSIIEQILENQNTIIENITNIQANIMQINNNMILMNSTLHEILNKIEVVNNRIIIINTSIGNIMTNLTQLRASIEQVTDQLVILNTSIGSLAMMLNNTIARSTSNIINLIDNNSDMIVENLGSIMLLMNTSFDDINKKLVKIENNTLVIETRLGEIIVNLSLVEARLERVENGIAVLQTKLGTVEANLSLLIDGMAGDLKSLNESVGVIVAELDSGFLVLRRVNDTVYEILTRHGAIVSNISNIMKVIGKIDNSLNVVGSNINKILIEIDKLDNAIRNINCQQAAPTQPQAETIQNDVNQAKTMSVVATGLSAISLLGVAITLLRTPLT